jgi:tagatose 1,6-diphosphate aldolase GatY/KbaY
MPYVTSLEMLKSARRDGYAVGAFNIENMEMAQAVIAAATEARAPVILALTPKTVQYAPPGVFVAMVRALAGAAPVPVALHLDHGDSLETVRAALEAGFTSTMLDGSTLPYEENVAAVAGAVRLARGYGVPVEGELGTVGGKEDGHVAAGPQYTDPDQAADFVQRTGISSLAVAIGTAHGPYKETPRLDIHRLEAIARAVSLPLALHGASGLTDEAIAACIARGISKVNFATELRQAFSDALRQAVQEKPGVYDPKKLLAPARDAVLAQTRARMLVLGCAGRAR